MNTQFTNSDNLTTVEMTIQEELRQFWKKFGSGKFRTTRNCAVCSDELIEFPEFTELILPVNENHINLGRQYYTTIVQTETTMMFGNAAGVMLKHNQ